MNVFDGGYPMPDDTREPLGTTERQLWTTGRRGCNACINISIYEHSIVATAESDKITVAMMTKALRREFPHTFYNSSDGGDYLRMDADRWDGDGLAQVEGDLCEKDKSCHS